MSWENTVIGAFLVIIGALVATGIILAGVTVIDTSAADSQPNAVQDTETPSTASTPTETTTTDESEEPTGSVLLSEHSCEEHWGELECEVTVNANYADGVEHYLVTFDSAYFGTRSYGVDPGDADTLQVEPDTEIVVYVVDGDDEASVIGRWTVAEDGIDESGEF